MLVAFAMIASLGLSTPERPDLHCGTRSCYIALAALGFEVGSFAQFENRIWKPTAFGYSLQQLKEVAIMHGAHAECVVCDFDALALLPASTICIPLLKGGHFVAIIAFDARNAWVVDAPDFLEWPRSMVEARWPGEAVLISTGPLPKPANPSRPNLRRAVALIGLAGAVGMAAIFRRRMRVRSRGQ